MGRTARTLPQILSHLTNRPLCPTAPDGLVSGSQSHAISASVALAVNAKEENVVRGDCGLLVAPSERASWQLGAIMVTFRGL